MVIPLDLPQFLVFLEGLIYRSAFDQEFSLEEPDGGIVGSQIQTPIENGQGDIDARLIDDLCDIRRQIVRPLGAACDHHEEESDPEPANDLRLAVLKLHALTRTMLTGELRVQRL